MEPFDVITLGIPITNTWKQIEASLNMCDGIILPGGSKCTNNDLKLVKYLYKNNIPTLGICLGMQTMAFAFNNHSEIRIPNHNSEEKYVHNVKINKDSLLYKIIGSDTIKVNSRHNYAIPVTDFKINAISDDNIIEGIEDSSKKFFLGVEWHPESLVDNNTYKLFQYFINII